LRRDRPRVVAGSQVQAVAVFTGDEVIRAHVCGWRMVAWRLGAWLEFDDREVSLVVWILPFGVRLAVLWFPSCDNCSEVDCRGDHYPGEPPEAA